MKNKFLWLGLVIILVFSFAGSGWSDEAASPNAVMRPDRETRLKWFKAYEEAPKARIDQLIQAGIPLRGSHSLLSHLDYITADRNQGWCGNCWAWAGTGVMEIALDVEENVFDRLSVQYNNSCGGTGGDYGCCGGWLSDLADFYSSTGFQQAIPWSNTNASWQDGGYSQRCGQTTSVTCGSISTTPNYPIDSIDEVTIETHGVGQATAITNIKNILHQNRAVWFGFFLPTEADGNNFRSFWNDQGENDIWNPDYSCGHTWNNGFGHAVLCVGYNDDDPNNRYWIMVNSWGDAGGDRLNGIFRLDMDMNYDCTYQDGGLFWSFYWQTLDIDYGSIAKPDLVVLSIETDPVEPDPGETMNVYVTVKNEGAADAGGFYIEWYPHLTSPPSTFQSGDRWEWVSSLAAGATHTMSKTYTYGSTGNYSMYAQVDSWEEVTESKEYNNVLGPVSIIVGPCECDLNHDGSCNIMDWPYFIEDWGSNDCPVFSLTSAAQQVPPNDNMSGYPGERPSTGVPALRSWKVENALTDGNLPAALPPQKEAPQKAVPIVDTDIAPNLTAVFEPLWSKLEKLSQADKDNAVLQLEVDRNLSAVMRDAVVNVEALWNNGKFDEAIQALQNLESDGLTAAAGIGWKIPKKVEGLQWSEGDVRIGTRSDIVEASLDFDAESGNLFAALRLSDASLRWTVNISTDNGTTWQETFQWFLLDPGDTIVDVSASVVADYLYVGYVAEGDSVATKSAARIRRFALSNGAADSLYAHKIVFDKGTDIKEIKLVSNTDTASLDNRIFYFAILNDFRLIFYWANQEGASWSEYVTGVVQAWQGLDATWNEGSFPSDPNGWFLYLSFVGYVIGADEDINSLYVLRIREGGAELIEVDPEPYWNTPTSISAYDDHIITVFEYRDASNNPGIKYWISYDAGDYWSYGHIAPAEEGSNFWRPAVAARKGGGIAVVYQQEVGEPDPCWYRYRNYSGSIWWTSPEQYNEIDVATGSAMELEYLPPLPGHSYAHGSIWESYDPDGAFFDRSDGGNVCECDLNHDGYCNIMDWPYFIQDWGRTDCPVP